MGTSCHLRFALRIVTSRGIDDRPGSGASPLPILQISRKRRQQHAAEGEDGTEAGFGEGAHGDGDVVEGFAAQHIKTR